VAGIFVRAELVRQFHTLAEEWLDGRMPICLEGPPRRNPGGQMEILLRVDAGLVEFMRERGFPLRDEPRRMAERGKFELPKPLRACRFSSRRTRPIADPTRA
jgi:hypothetical protein